MDSLTLPTLPNTAPSVRESGLKWPTVAESRPLRGGSLTGRLDVDAGHEADVPCVEVLAGEGHRQVDQVHAVAAMPDQNPGDRRLHRPFELDAVGLVVVADDLQVADSRHSLPLPDPGFAEDMEAVLAEVGPVPEDPWARS